MIDTRHGLVKLAALVDREVFRREWATSLPSHLGRPATSPRVVAGLMYLRHAFKLSDEAVVARWVESPYHQHFTGETFFQHRPPIDPSSLTRWRKRIGEEGVEWLLTKTIEAGRASGAVTDKSLKRIAVDATGMEKAIAHPTDARLYERARSSGWPGEGSRGRSAPKLRALLSDWLSRWDAHAHARKFKRMRKALRQLKGYVGRVRREGRSHLQDIPEGAPRGRVLEALWLVGRLLEQTPKSKNKIDSLHEPDVDCISKGKARIRYEFGTKVSLATTFDGGFAVSARSFPGNPCDGHTPAPALAQVAILTEQMPALAIVDRGYRGHGVETIRVLISGTRRGITPLLAKLLKRQSAIEPEIGHMKTDDRLARCPLKGRIGDAAFAVLCAGGHDILAHLRAFWSVLLYLINAVILRKRHRQCVNLPA